MQRGQAANVLQVDRAQQQEPAEARERRYRDQGSAGERRAAEEPDVEQRLVTAALVPGEPRRRERRGGEAADDERRGPAAAGAFDDRVDQRGQGDHHEQLADRVEPARPGRLRLGHEQRGQDDRGDAHRDVDPEDAAPADGGDQHAADHRPEGQAQADDSAPDPDRSGALTPFGERVRDDRHRDRVQHRPADGLHRAERDQCREAGRQAAQQRSEREQGQSDLEGTAAADAIAGRSGQHEQARDHQRVRGDDPLQSRDRGVQLMLDRGQRDVDDRDVQPDDEQAHAADRKHEHPPGPA